MRRVLDQDPILLLGIGLVLMLVAALPLALALSNADMQSGDAGFGSGAGELSAAALSSLDRDLQTRRLLPTDGGTSTPCFLALRVSPGVMSHGEREPAARSRAFLQSIEAALASGPAHAGPGADGIPLLL